MELTARSPTAVPTGAARMVFAGLALVTIVIGLAVHLGARSWPTALRDVSGDALWATMMAWWVGALVPTWPVLQRGVAALATCWLVEASQLVHVAWLDAVRATRVGHLVLGSGFDPRDLVAYVAGVMVAIVLERAWRGRRVRGASGEHAGSP